MIHDLPVTAGQAGVALSLTYNGFPRIVEVHAVGVSSAGNRLMRVWQVSGGSKSGKFTGWKLMTVSDASNLALTEQVSEAPREGYRRGDRAMVRRIDWQI
ncbi:MAG: hypothetical protein AAF941_09275 [Pseudomonadota bacterium]